ncbi:ABC transporter ATP-binding protein [Streptomyces resistomycificus]|uniref:ABC transporter ATP-binding protein n=1 Tax=Streptomyces resistomycificus TaxID=67356 RepID=UPI0004AB99A1|nr:ATP-binding cassette domain-containing protein [Streptomyces resistomycificus]
MSGSIDVRGLSRTFHTTVRRPGFTGALRSLVNPERVAKQAVCDISFDVAPGELLALLGPNGAGKSTTIKVLTGILTPTSGTARVAGVVPYEERERNARNIGAVFGQRTQLWCCLFLRDIYEVPKAEHAARLKEFDDLLDLSSFWDTRVRHLSLGQRVRSDLAAALLHDPQVVFLDEPTIGMDVVVKEQVREFLRHQVEQRGRTVLLTTHDMTEVERLAERVVLINHGRLVLDGSLDEIRRRFGSTWQVRATLADAHTEVQPLPGIEVLRHEGARVVFGPASCEGADAPTVHQALKAVIERYEVTDIAIDEADLEDVMRAAYVHAEAA